MISHIIHVCHGPLFFETENSTGKSSNVFQSLCAPMLHLAMKRPYFSARKCASAHLKPSCNLIERQGSRPPYGEGRTCCLASTLSQSDILRFLSAQSCQMKNLLYTPTLPEKTKSKNTAQIHLISLDHFSNVRYNKKLLLNYTTKEICFHIENIMV